MYLLKKTEDNLKDILHPDHLVNAEKRFYCLNNMYLNGIQAGIQSAHGIAEIVNKYLFTDLNLKTFNSHELEMVKNTFNQDKTIIVLNGGDQQTLSEHYSFIDSLSQYALLPFARFFESERALNSALTNVALILPENIFNPAVKNLAKKVDLYLRKQSNEKHHLLKEGGKTLEETVSIKTISKILKEEYSDQSNAIALTKIFSTQYKKTLTPFEFSTLQNLLESKKTDTPSNIFFLGNNDHYIPLTVHDLYAALWLSKFRLF